MDPDFTDSSIEARDLVDFIMSSLEPGSKFRKPLEVFLEALQSNQKFPAKYAYEKLGMDDSAFRKCRREIRELFKDRINELRS